MKKIVILLSLLTFGIFAMASVQITGHVINSDTSEPVEMAAVQLLQKGTMLTGVQTTLDGDFTLEKVKDGNYQIVLSSLGYLSDTLPVTVKGKDINMGTLKLKEDVLVLNEVKVTGHAAEMTVKGDTLEYNAAAIHTGEGAMVEDMLKKMSGVEVDSEGNITVNGESISGVRIDGKKFFGNDVQTATKNIPADMIDKIQVYDKKSDMAKLTGFEDDDTERIINLTLKADRKKGVFGNFTGGLGHDLNFWDGGEYKIAEDAKDFFQNDFRYNANIFTNIMLGESQTTLLGSANNVNEMRSGRGRGGFGGMQNSGITWTENLGVNTNIDLSNKVAGMLMGGDVQLNHNINDNHTRSQKEQYAQEDLTYFNNDSTSRRTQTWNANLRLEFEWDIDSLNTLILQPTIGYTNTQNNNYNEYDYSRNDTLVTDGKQTNVGLTQEITAGGKLTYSHKFYKPGRTFTVMGNFNFSNSNGTSHNWSENNSHTGETIAPINQFTDKKNNNFGYEVKASFVEPLYANNHLLEISLDFSGKKRTSDKFQYNDSAKTDLDSLYSNRFVNNFYSESLELNYRWMAEKYDLTAGFRINPSQTQSSTTYMISDMSHDTLVNVWNFSPNFSFKYKFGKKEFARIIYRGTTNQPSVSQMEPVRDNSNAMSETVGNLDLNPAFRSTVRLMYSKFNQETFSSIMAGLQGNFTKDALVNNTIYDKTGKVYRQTINAEGMPFNVSADFMYGVPFANKMFNFNTRTMVSYNQNLSYQLKEQDADVIAEAIANNALMLGEKSQTGNIRASEDLNLRFVHEIVDVGIRGNFTYSRSSNSLNKSNVNNVFNWTISGDIAFHLPKNWEIATDCGYTARYGYHLDDVNEIMWNASVSKSWPFGSLMLKAYDMLNQKKNIMQTIGDNYVQYQKFNTLPTYFMLTFTYKLNKMGDLKASGMAGHVQQMMESGIDPTKGPRPGGPMGPAPRI